MRRHRRSIVVMALAMALAAPSAAEAANGLVAAYGFEETSGSSVTDSSQTGNDGTVNGPARSDAGKFGRGLSFDGTNDLVTVPDSPSLDLSTGMTLEGWVFPTTLANYRTLVVKEQPADLAYALYAASVGAGPRTDVFTSADLSAARPAALPPNAWSHLASTYDGTTLRLYVNGALAAQSAVSGSIRQSDRPLQIGGNTIWREWFKGRLDEVRVYDRALSAAEIEADLARPVASGDPPPPPPPPPPGGDPAQVGRWEGPFSWPLVTVHAQVLSNGKVLLWDAFEFATNSERIWDPATNTFASVPYGRNLFCAAHVNLPDGRSLIAGGHVLAYQGLKDTSLFDWHDNSWTRGADMARARWYPTTVTLPDGRVLVAGGDDIRLNTPGAPVAIKNQSDSLPEIYDVDADRWTQLPSARRVMPLYPQFHVLPDGRVADVGPDLTTHALDLESSTWSPVTTSGFDGNSSVQYRPGRILKSGSWADPAFPGYPIGSRAATIDFTTAGPSWTERQAMKQPRAYHTLSMLPDGTVLAGPGQRASDGIDPVTAEKSAEIWDPATGSWAQMASATVPRMYHTTQVLLPDGRVLVAGSGRVRNSTPQANAEIFSPPYLFKGPRPTIASAPAAVPYDAAFTVDTPQADRIRSVALVHSPSVTHGFDFDNRYVPLSFTRQGSTLRIQGPAGPATTPPGMYMLWIVDDNGVPAVAPIVSIQPSGQDTQAPSAPPNLTATGATERVDLNWGPATDNVGVTAYAVHRATTPNFTPTTANRIAVTSARTYADAPLAAGTYHYVVTARDAAGNVSVSSREEPATVTPAGDTTPPAVALSAPADGATVTGTVAVTATASDDNAVAGVRFKLDGADLGGEDSSSPYAVDWDTRAATSGPHTLTAVARDAAGNTRTAATHTITVENSGPPAGGLVAAYGFEEPSGAGVADASGRGNTGTLEGPARTPGGRFGSALSFDGVNDLVTVADSPSLHASTGLTLEAWVYPTTSAGWRTVLLKERSDYLAWALYASIADKRPNARVFTTADLDTSGTAPLPVNAWSHLAATYDGAALRIYVDGRLASERAVTGGLVPSDRPLRIGGNTIWREWFRGRIDEVRVYDRALSAAEITADRDKPVGTPP